MPFLDLIRVSLAPRVALVVVVGMLAKFASRRDGGSFDEKHPHLVRLAPVQDYARCT